MKAPSARLPAAAVCVAALGLCGFTVQQANGLAYDPNHYVNNDPMWGLLNQAEVTVDEKKGEYHAAFQPDLLHLAGTKLKITGFMMPLDPAKRTLHFALVRRNSACPFCPPNSPTEAVEVYSSAMVAYTGDEIAVTGRLTLVSNSSLGMFYRLDDARVVEDN